MNKILVFRLSNTLLRVVAIISILLVNTISVFAAPLATAVTAGIYDDTVNWIYSGSWTAVGSVSGPYSSTDHYSNDLTATASFTFSGAQFVFYYTTHPNRGNIQVWVDGSLAATINATGALQWQSAYTSPLYPLGTHTVVIKHGGPSGYYIDVDAIRVVALYDDFDSGWSYLGLWTGFGPVSGPYNNTDHYTNDLSATASFTFTGTGFVFYYTKYTNRGNIQVWVDSSLAATINATGALQWLAAYTSPTYPLATHTVVIKHGGPSGYYIDVDAIKILP